MVTSPPRLTYRPDVDGLRAIAILTVVGYHVGIPGFSGGFVGVDVFFVVSGYLITGLLLQELLTTGRLSLLGFYARRVRRLLPALIASIAITGVAALFVLLPDPELRWFLQSVASVTAAASNVFFYVKTDGYFDAAADTQPLLHTWSLSVEEQFYAVWPLLMWLVFRLVRDRRRALTRVILGASLISFVGAALLVRVDQSAAFYMMPARLWELGLGAVLAVTGWRLRRAHSATAAVGVGLIVMSVLLLDDTSTFPGLTAVPVVAGTAFVVAAGTGTNAVSRALAHPYAVAIGLRSYSWYLLHWPALALVRIHTMEHHFLRDLGIAVATLVLADLFYRYVEQPFRSSSHLPSIVRTPRRAVVSGLAGLAVMASVAVLLIPGVYSVSRIPLSPSLAAALQENRTARDMCPNLPPSAREAVDCTAVAGAVGAPRLVLAGDSHALALLPAVSHIATDRQWQLDVMWDTGCPFLPDYSAIGEQRQPSLACVEENRIRRDSLQDDPPAVVVITGRYGSYLSEGAGLRDTQASLAAGLRTFLAGLAAPTLIVQEVPAFPHNVPECLIRRASCEVQRSAASAHRLPHSEVFQQLAAEDSAAVWDPFETLCGPTTCQPQSASGEVWYRDRDHLSRAGAHTLIADLEELLHVR